jgi:hypothetical protein
MTNKPQNAETPANARVLEYRYRDSNPFSALRLATVVARDPYG